ncbi:GDSL-type esterase/lipase family protein [uncultured Tateyamaria sp.]|uniref:SGNH/GDSL hydrolase family protein n=1 Tax=uncultured Tateyamaria sp. TaxID=455651 RepID=UPI002634E88D|nr:GDSL-type esterase/lipase family protein [uncultured Tateyamaria sp.]
MSIFRILGWAGWLAALAAVAACYVVLTELQDTRRELRLETLRLPPAPATRLPDTWQDAPYRVLLVGDSRIAEWYALPNENNVVFATSGVGGESTAEVRERFARDVLALDPAPDEIVLAAGINDLVGASVQTRNVPGIHDLIADRMLGHLAAMAEDASAQGIKVNVATIVQPTEPDLQRSLLFWDDVLYELVSEANARIAELGYDVIDFNQALSGGDGPLPGEYSRDTLHFNQLGYTTLNDALSKAFSSR